MPELYPVLISAVVAVVAAAAITVYLDRLRAMRSRYNEIAHRFELDKLREQLEREKAELEKRMSSTAEKWHEMYQHVVAGQTTTTDLAIRPIPQSDFLRSFGIDPRSIEIERDLAFVLMPFHSDFHSTYNEILAACSDIGLQCMRGDEANVRGDILPHILASMCRARVVVAVVQDRNPNVFYELGIAHALDKSTVLLARNLEDVPFDLRGKQVLLYKSNIDLREQLRHALVRIAVHR